MAQLSSVSGISSESKCFMGLKKGERQNPSPSVGFYFKVELRRARSSASDFLKSRTVCAGFQPVIQEGLQKRLLVVGDDTHAVHRVLRYGSRIATCRNSVLDVVAVVR